MAFLEVRDMRKNFGGTEVLKGVSFSLEKGKVLAVIGSSGNGKTTLLRCLNGLEEADGGSVTVDGVTANYGATTEENAVNGGKKPKKKKRAAEKGAENRDFTLVFQNFQLFPQYTAKRNVSLAADLSELRALKTEKLPRKEKSVLKKQIREKNDENARRLLEKVGLAEKCAAYPCELSGGQQQRVAIARALALHPDILCFDEPTSALDPELTGEVLRVLRELADHKTTMIIVTHEMKFARDAADRILFMDGGVVVEQGDAKELIDHPKEERTRQFLASYGK